MPGDILDQIAETDPVAASMLELRRKLVKEAAQIRVKEALCKNELERCLQDMLEWRTLEAVAGPGDAA